jgi:threonine/homoserine/homoserine lactone efflux protein
MPQHLWLFLVGSIVITLVPGADMALVTRQVVTRGRRAAQVTVFGNVTGIVVHAAALGAGLSALIVASATAYTTVKLAGAAYLVYLGAQSLRQARRTRRERTAAVAQPVSPRRGSPYLAGLISTVLNPKPALFFLSYLPQFIDRSHSVAFQLALLASIHIVVGLVWLSTYAWLVSRLQVVLARPRVKAAMESVSGAVLVALGVRVALER